ncbi:MAG: D-tyrosyl-tRNA(Tyr) deacylase [Thermoanaerobaculia bacterium]|nr:D-tyrosyl-tRNA(Tyr) deacylase [Thermoanaerobaculia bacterium]
MRTVLQRVSSASVVVDGVEIGAIGPGLLALVAIERGDDPSVVELAANKIATLRIFSDAAGKMNLDVEQANGSLLVVSQFTLAANLEKGRRPSFERAAPPAEAEILVETLVRHLRLRGLTVECGRFGADMKVSLVNDGPVTIVLELGTAPP